MKTFQAGDHVQMVNGGPTMIVIGAGEMDGEISCEWTSDGDLVCDTFLECALVKLTASRGETKTEGKQKNTD